MQKHNTKKLYDIFICIFLAAAAAALVIFPDQSVSAAQDGLALCAQVIVPSLFPFFVIAAMTVETGLASKLGRLLDPVMRPLFNLSGRCSAVLVLGLIGGYPVGARTTAALYDAGECTLDEAERMMAFCNNSGPAFIFGVVGAGIFSSGKIGLLLFISHIASSLAIGILFRHWKSGGRHGNKSASRRAESAGLPLPAAFVTSVKSSFASTLNICGFVIFFTVVIRLLDITGVLPAAAGALGRILSPIGIDSRWAERFLTGFFELSSGVGTLKSAGGELRGAIAMAAFMLGWAGVSIHCQVLSLANESGIPVKSFIIGKALHGIISAAVAYVLSGMAIKDVSAAEFLAVQSPGISFTAAIPCAAASCLLLLFLLPVMFLSNRSGKGR